MLYKINDNRQMLTYGRRIPLPELDYRIEVTILKMLALYVLSPTSSVAS